LAAITFLLAAVALQLYFNKDFYFAMNRAKCSFTMIVLMGAVLTAFVWPIERIRIKRERQRMTLLDWCVLAYGCGSLITCLLSQDPPLTFVGTKGMFVGAFTYVTGMLVYFVVSRNMIPSKWIVGTLVAAWTVIFIWTIVNQCGTDINGMHQNMRPGDELGYVASMGNNNSACDAFATIIPFTFIILLMTRKRALAAVCFIGLFAAYSLGCEGVLIGILTIVPFIVISAMSEPGKVKRAIGILLLVGLSITLFHFLGICSVVKSSSGMIQTVSNLWVGEMLSVIAVVLLVLYNRGLLALSEKPLKTIRSVLAWACVAVLVGFVAVSVAKSFYDINYGTTRGAIWKGSVWAFRLYNPVEMIFGQGSGMFAQNVTLAFSMLFDKESSVTFATCHNSLLQALLGNGIVGLVCLLTGLFALLRDWFRELRPIVLRPEPKNGVGSNVAYEEVIRVASFVAVMGYFGSSLVESTYPHTVILLFAMLGLYRSCFFVPNGSRDTGQGTGT